MTFPTNHIKRTSLKSLHSSLIHIWLRGRCRNLFSLPACVNDKGPCSAYDYGKCIRLLPLLLKYHSEDCHREFLFEILWHCFWYKKIDAAKQAMTAHHLKLISGTVFGGNHRLILQESWSFVVQPSSYMSQNHNH